MNNEENLSEQRRRELAEKAEPTLITVDGKKTKDRNVGTYTAGVTAQLVKESKKIVTSRDIARVQYGRVNQCNEEYVRRRLSVAVRELQDEGVLCYTVYEPSGRHKVTGIKPFLGDETDKVEFPRYLKRALARKELTEQRYEQLIELAREVETANKEGELFGSENEDK